jgi:hypothetical protein
MITKTDFLDFLKTPMHLWASKHDQIEKGPSPYDQHRMEQGKEIENLARQFIKEHLLHGATAEIEHEKTFIDGNFQARVDTVAYYPAEGTIDIYEIKSSSSVKKEDKYDGAFQRLVCEANETVRDVYIVHLNKEYIRQGELELEELFIADNINEDIEKIREEVIKAREEANRISMLGTPELILACVKPDECPCPTLCHGELPDYPIYDIPRLNHNKALGLREMGILAIQDIPAGYPLSVFQSRCVEVVKSGEPISDTHTIRYELDKLEYPLNFLDYETYNPGIPFFDGYRPYQHVVFQYSLHIVENPESVMKHHEVLFTDEGDPGIRLVEHLSERIANSGSVIVWHKPFEVGRNKEMAEQYPEYRDFLLDVNARIYDLKEIFSKGLYIHPDFHGSASIKNVLPVLVPEFDQNYAELHISQGEEAMLAWADIMAGNVPQEQVTQLRKDLLSYCELDTLAMVKIWEALKEEVL